ncbi:MAG TPA: triose-phosphate isomerase [Hyphomonadaceae bacterium]|nr:triose-phosphate isomerase [Hyphomonadaceae bacterium]
MSTRKKLVAGNWKMNGVAAALSELGPMIEWARSVSTVELAICPPATLAGATSEILKGTPVRLGGQDCHAEKSGAFTGNVSAEMWADLGARYVIVGHSERRAMHHETDAIVAAKAQAVMRAGLVPIICLGETLAERDAGKTLDVIATQLAGSVPEEAARAEFVIAYEPVWAIGTGRTPTIPQVAEVHVALRNGLAKRFGQDLAGRTRLLYGGSVKPDNAKELMHAEGVDGALVGGASLKAADFLKIAQACL